MKRASRADANGVKLRLLLPIVLLAGLAMAPAAVAVPVSEQGDAGETPATAQILTTQLVTSISGQLAGADSDLYRICLAGGRTLLGHDRGHDRHQYAALPLRRRRPGRLRE